MAHVQEHKFVDLAKPVAQPQEPKGMSRRSFLASVSGLAAVTAMAPEAFARNFIDQYDPDGPIAVRVVSERDYTTWLEQMKKKYASDEDNRSNTLAAVTK